MVTYVSGTPSCTSRASVPVISDSTFSALNDMEPHAMTTSVSFFVHKATVVFSVETLSCSSKFVCSFITITYCHHERQSLCMEVLNSEPSVASFFATLSPVAHFSPLDSTGGFSTVVDLWVVDACLFLDDLRPLYGI